MRFVPYEIPLCTQDVSTKIYFKIDKDKNVSNDNLRVKMELCSTAVRNSGRTTAAATVITKMLMIIKVDGILCM